VCNFTRKCKNDTLNGYEKQKQEDVMEEKKSTKIKWLDGIFVFILTCLPLFLIWHFDAKIVFFNNDDL